MKPETCATGVQVRLQSMLLLGSASAALVVARAPLRACVTLTSGVPQVHFGLFRCRDPYGMARINHAS